MLYYIISGILLIVILSQIKYGLFFFFLLAIVFTLYNRYYDEHMYEGGVKIGLGGICSDDNDCVSNNCVEGRCVKYHGCI